MIRALLAAVCFFLLAGPSAADVNAGGGVYCSEVRLKSAEGVPSGFKGSARHDYVFTATCKGPDPDRSREQTGKHFKSWKYWTTAFVTFKAVWDAKDNSFGERLELEGGAKGTIVTEFKCSDDPYLKNIACAMIGHKNSSQWDILMDKPLRGRPIGQGFVNRKEAAELSEQAAKASKGSKSPPPPPPPPPQALGGGMEDWVDRPGGDFHGFVLTQAKPSPEQCRQACTSHKRCRAWTYVKPGKKGPKAVCYLKDRIPPPRKDSCCVSGLKRHLKAPPKPKPELKAPPKLKPAGKAISNLRGALMEQGVDRPGGDYHGFPLTQAKPALCQQACRNDARCRAWTYVKPGIKGPQAACYLKNSVPGPRKDACCVSGVK